MKIKSYLLAGLATFALASCDESFNDWTEQAANMQGETVAFGNGAVKAVALIDFSQIDENTDSVQVCEITKTPTSTNGDYTSAYTLRIPYTNKKGENQVEVLKMGSTGKVKYADFKSFVETVYSKRPQVNEITASVRATMSMNNTNASFLTSDNFVIQAKPNAPIIEGAYYYYGASTDWSTINNSYKLVNSGADVYVDPVFTAIVPAPKNADGTAADNSFKIVPESAFTADDFEANVIGAAENGEKGLEGNFVQGKDKAGAWNITDKDAKYYKIELNMLERTYKVTPLKFEEIMFVSGGGNGWSETEEGNDYLTTSTYDGKYEGYMYLDGEFKVKTSYNWKGTNYGQGFSTAPDAANMSVEQPGYYKVSIDILNKKLETTAITSIGIVGAAVGSWDEDKGMTYNKDERCWEIKNIQLTVGQFKFRANKNWKIAWGGDFNKLDSRDGGPNCECEAEGTYDIKLYAWAYGKAKCELIKK